MSIFRKKYLDIDVLTAARQRYDRIMEEFDDVYVAFSGGKDSLVCLHLLKEAYERHGRPFPVKASFLDEELIPDSVVNFVDGYRREPWLDLFWFAFPLESNKFRLGKVEAYIQWDPDRPHVREVPPWAIRPAAGQRGPFSQYNMMSEVAKRCRGRIANITGIRADESLNRYCGVAQVAPQGTVIGG
jgi:predicted phosphoadenosine phosphosulfate sulfurtransferase